MKATLLNLFTLPKSTNTKIDAQGSNEKMFVLSYGSNPIGYLKSGDDIWTFEYSDWFKHQDDILPLLEFPKKDKVYKATQLWPFFSSRIPSKINLKLTDKNKHSTTSSIVELLEVFGKRTVNNPFVLESFK